MTLTWRADAAPAHVGYDDGEVVVLLLSPPRSNMVR
jgi:hypothetical protein